MKKLDHDDGYITYDENDLEHTDNDIPSCVYKGTQRWCKHGSLHREEGPSWLDNNEATWFKNGFRHRLDGPAVIWKTPGLFADNSYWIDGNLITLEQFKQRYLLFFLEEYDETKVDIFEDIKQRYQSPEYPID